MIKNYGSFLLEGKNLGSLYHIVDMEKMSYILDTNSITSYHFSKISTTRDKMMNWYEGDKPTSIFKIELNGDLLSHKYKIKPFAFISKTNVRFDESEEQIQTNRINNVSKYINKIIIIKKRIEGLKNSGWFTTNGGYYKKERRNIPELLKEFIDRFKEYNYQVYVQDGSVIKKDDDYINSIINHKIEKIYHGYAYYLRGHKEVYDERFKTMVGKDVVIPLNKKNKQIDQLVIGYDYENLYLNTSYDINKKTKLPKDFHLYVFDYEYDVNDSEEIDNQIFVKSGHLANIKRLD